MENIDDSCKQRLQLCLVTRVWLKLKSIPQRPRKQRMNYHAVPNMTLYYCNRLKELAYLTVTITDVQVVRKFVAVALHCCLQSKQGARLHWHFLTSAMYPDDQPEHKLFIAPAKAACMRGFTSSLRSEVASTVQPGSARYQISV